MKKILMVIMTTLAFLASASSFSESKTTGFSKNSPQLNALSSAFKNHSSIVPKIDPNDITMGYAGQDLVNRKPVILF